VNPRIDIFLPTLLPFRPTKETNRKNKFQKTSKTLDPLLDGMACATRFVLGSAEIHGAQNLVNMKKDI